jgi:hypothetical protein
MRKNGIVLAILFLLTALLLNVSAAAAADGYYHLSEVSQPPWDATPASRLAAPTTDYDYAYGDDESVSFNLPWNMHFYGQNYSRVTADTNGNIWFGASDSAYAVDLANTGRGPVISAWNNDLSSNYYGGVFIQHKTNPERMVVEWQTETYTEEGLYSPNNFAVVIYPDGTIRYDYKTFTTQNGSDAGSGISRGDGSAQTNLTTQFGNVFGLAGRSFQFTPQSLFTVAVTKEGPGTGIVASSPSGISCGTVCSGNFAPGTTLILAATPSFGSQFSSWSGACTGTDPCTLTLDGAKSVTATFAESFAPAIAINSPSGSVTVARPELNYTVSTGTVVVKVDGTVVGKVSGDTLDNLPDGVHVLRVEAVNAAGHLGFAQSSFTIDTTAPVVTSITPASGSSNVPVRMSILVQFGEQLDVSSVTTGTASLVSNGMPVPGDISLSGDGRSLIFKPRGKLAYAASFTFTLKAGVRDLLGNALPSDLSTSFVTPTIDPDLVGYWPMDDDWNDYSGKGNNATAQGSATFISAGNPGVDVGSFVIDSGIFSGSAGYVSVQGQARYLADVANSFTMTFRAKPTATRLSTPEGLGGPYGTSGQRYAIGPFNPTDIGFEGAGIGVSVGTNGISVFENTSILDGIFIWTHFPSLLVYDAPAPLTGWNDIAVVINDRRPSLYINGELVRTGLQSTQPFIYPSTAFGDTRYGNGSYSGQLAGMSIYNRALTAPEVQGAYQNSARQAPEISISSSAQSAKCKPGETCSATVTASAATGLVKLYCSSTGAAGGVAVAAYFETPQNQTTQQLTFQVAPEADPYASYLLSCIGETAEGVFGVSELRLQVEDVVPPTVVNSTPADYAADVSATMPLTVTFSEAMDRGSFVAGDTCTFQRADTGAFVPARFELSSDGKTLVSYPPTALEAATPYIVTVSNVRDLAGNPILSPYLLHFTTLQQTALHLENLGSPETPYVMGPGRYGTLTLTNSTVVYGGAVTVDSLVLNSSTLKVNTGALNAPANLSVVYGDMVLTGSTLNLAGTLNLSANMTLTDSTVSVADTALVAGNAAVNNSTLTLKNILRAGGDLTLRNHSLLTHFAASTTDTSRLDITAVGIDIDTSSKIDVSGKGYLGGFQRGDDPFSYRRYLDYYNEVYVTAPGENGVPTGRTDGNTTLGGSTAGSGGSYGGLGGLGSYGGGNPNSAYGDPSNGSGLGSGGSGHNDDMYTGISEIYKYYSGGNGGGSVRLAALNLRLDGAIVANGSDAQGGGGGSGGGVRIDVANLTGVGTINANGGVSTASYMEVPSGGGGGGRIAITYDYYDSVSLPVAHFLALGGAGSSNGGAGTVYLKDNARDRAALLVDDGGAVGGSTTPLYGGNYEIVEVKGGATIAGSYTSGSDTYFNNARLSFKDVLNLPGNLIVTDSILDFSGRVGVPGNLTVTRSTLNLAGGVSVSGDLTLTGSVLTHPFATASTEYRLDVSVLGTLNVDAASTIDVSARGYLGGCQGDNSGNAARTLGNTTLGGSTDFSGGSYGGLGGGGSPNATYGDPADPNAPGSGGGCNAGNPGGNGGGLVRVQAGSITLEGNILAAGGDGGLYNGSGGSGGGIRIDVGSLSGSGTVTAPGGAGANHSGGGGGRIAITYTSLTLPFVNVSAAGGVGQPGGSAGTVSYLPKSDTTPPYVVSVMPADGSGNLPLETFFAVRFSEPVDPAYVSAGSVTLTSRGASVPGVVTLSDDRTILTFTPANKLGASNSYAFTLKSGIRDLAGNAIVSDQVYSFSTLKISLEVENTGSASSPYVIDSGSYGTITLRNSFAVLNGAVSADEVNLVSNATLTQAANGLTGMESLDLTVSGLLNVDATSKIDVTGRGYLGAYAGGNGSQTGRTTGNSTNGGSTQTSGGSYGGLGGLSYGTVNQCYGDLLDPNEPGSGGASLGDSYPGGSGGGLLRITAGSMQLDGSLLADGGGSVYGGGSGGSIKITTGALAGAGFIFARGGSSIWNDYGTGGGGRIALSYKSLALPLGNVAASGGGSGARFGGAGTVYLKNTLDGSDHLIVDNRGINTAEGSTVLRTLGKGVITELTATTLTNSLAAWLPGSLKGMKFAPDATKNKLFTVLDNDATTIRTDTLEGDLTQFATPGTMYSGTYSFSNVSVVGKARLNSLDRFVIAGNLSVDGSTLIANEVSAGNVILNNGAVLSQWQETTSGTYKLELSVSGNLAVEAGSAIDVSGRGYLGGYAGGNGSQTGRTTGNSTNGGSTQTSGGSYGGLGGLSYGTVNLTYGNLENPDEPGSGGASLGGETPGGNGGGLLRITAGSIQLDGSVAANGGVSTYGGGSGGGIRIDTDNLSGGGHISARGGASGYSGGGGGRIALYYGRVTFPLQNVDAFGGSEGPGGAYGTVYLNSKDGAGVIDFHSSNQGTIGMPYVLPSGRYGTLKLDNSVVQFAGKVTADTVTLCNNSILTHKAAGLIGSELLDLEAQTVSIDVTSKIDVSGQGYLAGAPDKGLGNIGRTLGNTTIGGSGNYSGGSYGGLGGSANYTTTNTVYGDPTNPNQMGSGGGTGGGGAGNGGGLVRLKAGTLILDGMITADGGGSRSTGYGDSGSGGSGGGIRIDAATLSGTGMILARGGNSTYYSGGGGGRIAVYFGTMTLPKANITTSGGTGYANGGAGTLYLRSAQDATDQLIVDNRGIVTGEGSTPLRSLGSGVVTGLSATTLTSSGSNWQPGSLIGLRFAPDLTNSILFTVVDNDATTLHIDPIAGDLTQATAIGRNFSGNYAFTNLSITGKAKVDCLDRLSVGKELVLDDATVIAASIAADSITIKNGGVLTHRWTTSTTEYRLGIDVTREFSIDAQSKIDVSGRGYLGGSTGRTLGNTTVGGSGNYSGGSYGGLGGASYGSSANAAYGDLTNPDELGSGAGTGDAGAGNGGGLVRLKAGTLTLEGMITADGGASRSSGSGSSGSGGSGGGIRIDAATLAGSGTISARGGNSTYISGGGGGRIAVYFDSMILPQANINALGGTGYNTNGSDGSLFISHTER